MRKLITFVTVLSVVLLESVHCQDGFATLGDGTTGFENFLFFSFSILTEHWLYLGGAGGEVVSVCTEDELHAAVEDDIPRIVRILCPIEPTRRVRTGSNKSILGGNRNASISVHGLVINGKKNVIIRGLRFCCALAPDDGVTIDQSTNVWIDHNEFYSDLDHHKDYYDGLLDITRGSDFVTVSWNQFHDHYKTLLVGHSDNYGDVDAGKFHITFHHNHFYRCDALWVKMKKKGTKIFLGDYER